MSWVFPEDVDGWLSEAEGRALSVFASGKDVLEIGSYCGRSTICMAQTAKSIFCVDPFDGRGTPKERDTWDEFGANIYRYGCTRKVDQYRGTIEEVGGGLKPFDLVFIDGAHDLENVRNDIEWACTLLKPGGHIALHDYRVGIDQCGKDADVEKAVDDFIADGAEVVWRAGSVIVLRPPKHLVSGNEGGPKVVMGMPHGGNCVTAALWQFCEAATRRGTTRIKYPSMGSVLTLNFNRLWAKALHHKYSDGATHFVMLHDDVVPDQWWLDTLLDEMRRTGADLVSCLVPFRSEEGLTSTAMGDLEKPWRPMRRLTMHEAMELPETFSADDIDWGLPTLYFNTGCWIADLSKPWVDDFCFTNHERILHAAMPDGSHKFVADCISEDWAMSIALAKAGADVRVTRKVGLYHEHKAWHNRSAWGTWETDEEYPERIRRLQPVKPEPALA